MSEHFLEIARRPDGSFWASADQNEPSVEVLSWDDIRHLRGKNHLVDHWIEGDRQLFIDQYGHPFDDWWNELSAACAQALMANPGGSVPAEHHDEVKRALRHQPRQAGLGLDGSALTAELRAFVAGRAEKAASLTPAPTQPPQAEAD